MPAPTTTTEDAPERTADPAEKTPRARGRRRRVTDENGRRMPLWELALRYTLLLVMLALMIGPFLWQLSTSLKGPHENIFSSPPSFLPSDPTLHNYERVADTIPVWDYALNSLKVAAANVFTNCVTNGKSLNTAEFTTSLSAPESNMRYAASMLVMPPPAAIGRMRRTGFAG